MSRFYLVWYCHLTFELVGSGISIVDEHSWEITALVEEVC